MHFAIRQPIWNGGKRAVGLADYKIEAKNTIEVTYKDSSGQRVYPHTYSVTEGFIRKYPLRSAIKNVPPLRIIPIDDLEENRRR